MTVFARRRTGGWRAVQLSRVARLGIERLIIGARWLIYFSARVATRTSGPLKTKTP